MISVIMIVKNGEEQLPQTLDVISLYFNEIIILVDDSTSDNTLDIIKKYPSIKYNTFKFNGFGFAKKLAEEQSSNNWVLSLDADEVLDEESIKSITNINLQQTQNIYSFERKNFYNNKHINGASWNNDVVIRLYNRKHTTFENKHIHEFIKKQNNSNVIKIKGYIHHYPYKSISELITKMNYYSDLYISENLYTKTSSPLKAILKGGFAFFRDYFLNKGFLFGYEGYAISFTNAAGTFYKYLKLYEAQKKLKKQ